MMHRIIREHLEEILAGRGLAPEHPARKHLSECEECRGQVSVMREQAAILQDWRPVGEPELRAGFYARVLDRIEAQGPGSVFTLFFDSLFGRRIAMASLALALLLGVYVISSEQMSEPEIRGVDNLPQATLVSDLPENLPGAFTEYAQPRLVTGTPDQDAVLVNLVTYREQ
jgi:hypothetical protein